MTESNIIDQIYKLVKEQGCNARLKSIYDEKLKELRARKTVTSSELMTLELHYIHS